MLYLQTDPETAASQRRTIAKLLAKEAAINQFGGQGYLSNIFCAGVQCTHYTPEAEEEQTEPSFPLYYIFTKHKSIVQWS